MASRKCRRTLEGLIAHHTMQAERLLEGESA